MFKVYLSPALHATDNPTKCPDKCGENVHCNQYMDIVERRLRALGFEVRRGDAALTGSAAVKARTGEANTWGADVYYIAHSNAGGGRYGKTFYRSAKGKACAEILHKYRKALGAFNGSTHKVAKNTTFGEMKLTDMPTLYDELFFHDNEKDCAWFHAGGMEQIAEETVQALCEIGGVEYKPETADEPDDSDAGKGAENRCLVNLRLLEKGHKGKDVAALQLLLIRAGADIAGDGSFGAKTKTAVEAFQKAHGIGIDGRVGIKTWRALIEE